MLPIRIGLSIVLTTGTLFAGTQASVPTSEPIRDIVSVQTKETKKLKPIKAEKLEPKALKTVKTAEKPPEAAKTVVKQKVVNGSCAEMFASAGVAYTADAAELVRRESNCNPSIKNSSSGACGIAQELPCGKSGCSLGDGPCQIKWMQGYVNARYGGWSGAIAFHNANNWY